MVSQTEVGFHYDLPLKQQCSDKRQQQKDFGHLELWKYSTCFNKVCYTGSVKSYRYLLVTDHN